MCICVYAGYGTRCQARIRARQARREALEEEQRALADRARRARKAGGAGEAGGDDDFIAISARDYIYLSIYLSI